MYKQKIMDFFENINCPLTLEEVVEKTETDLLYMALNGNHPKRNMSIMFFDEMKKHFIGYCKGAFQDFEETPLKWISDFISVPVIGKTGDTLLTLQPVSYEEYPNYMGGLPERLKITAAVKGYLYGCSKVAVFILCRNTQKMFTLKYEGDFEDAFNSVKSKVDILSNSMSDLSPPKETAFLYGGSIMESPGDFEGLAVSEYLEGLSDLGEEKHRKDTKIHPSEFTYSSCDKRQVYRLLGYEAKPKISAHLRRIFDYGHSIHEVIQGAIKAHNDIVIEQKVNHDDLNMTGSCDGHLNNHVLEIKSKGSKGLQSMSSPSKEHLEQATIYAAGLNCSKVSILYVDKNTADVVEFVSDFDKNIWYKIKERAKNLLYHRDTKSFPSGIDKKYKCKECPYLEYCHPEWVN